MTYTTTARREVLQALHIPADMTGSLFRVTITAIDDEDPKVVAFRNLKGISDCELSLDDVKGARLCETSD